MASVKKNTQAKQRSKTFFENPVHVMVGYITLLALSVVVLVLVYSLQWYIVP